MGQPERFLLLALKSTSDTEHQRAFQVSARPQSPNHLCYSNSSVCRTEGRGKKGEKGRGEWEENMSIERFFHPFVAGVFSPLCLFHFAPWHRYPSLHLSFQSLSPHPLHLPSPFSALSSSPPLIHTAISPWFLEKGGTAATGIQTSWLNTHIHTHIGHVHYGMCIDRWEEMRGKFGKSWNMFGQKQEKGEATKSFTGECKSGLGRVVENWQQWDTCQQILSTSFIIYAMDMRYEVSFGLSQHFKM